MIVSLCIEAQVIAQLNAFIEIVLLYHLNLFDWFTVLPFANLTLTMRDIFFVIRKYVGLDMLCTKFSTVH